MGHLRKLWKSAHTFLLPALLYSCSTATLQILLVSPWGSVTMRISDRQPSWCRKVCFQLPDFSPLNYHGCHSRSLDCRGPCTVHWCKLPPPRTPERRPTPPSTSGYRSEVEWPHRWWSPQRWSRPELAGRWWQDPINVPTPHLKRVPLPWSAGVTAEPSPPQCKNNPFSQTTVDLLSSGRLVSFTELPRLVHHRSARQRWYSRARPVRLNCPGEITSRRCTPHARRLPLRFLEARAHKKNGNTDLYRGLRMSLLFIACSFVSLPWKKSVSLTTSASLDSARIASCQQHFCSACKLEEIFPSQASAGQIQERESALA